MTRYLEESPGVQSSSRLFAAGLVAACLLLAVVAAIQGIRGNASTVTALGAPIGALAAGAWGAMRERGT